MNQPTVEVPGRGYALGVRNPKTLPGAGPGCESREENERGELKWKAARRWAEKLGGKYVA